MEATQETIICGSCETENLVGHQFCENCGAPLSIEEEVAETSEIEETVVEKKKVKAPTKLQQSAALSRELAKKRLNKKQQVNVDAEISKGRVAIMIVAVLTFIGAIINHVSFNNELESLRNNPNFLIDEKAVSQMRMLIYVTYGLGVLYVGLWFWAKSNAFSACLTALVVYIACHGIAAIIDPHTIYRGIIIKFLVVILLIGAVKSALKVRGQQLVSN